MEISTNGLAIVQHFEGLFLTAYVDPVGVWTIGYGHTGPAAREGNTITEAEADALLRQDMTGSENSVSRFIEIDLVQHEYDALVSFTFNVGSGALSRSTLRRKLNEGDRSGAAAEFPRWNKGRVNGELVELPGLTRRRRSERHLFETGEVRFFDGQGVVDPDAAAPSLVQASSGGNYETDFAARVGSWNLQHFRPSELLTLGGSHNTPGSPAHGRNSRPPRSLWGNMETTIQALDKLRIVLNAPIHLLSVYRNDDYNRLVGGVPNSFHKEFRAIDFYAKSVSGPSHWASAMRDIRASGEFSGGIGIYDTFVHVDNRGSNVDF